MATEFDEIRRKLLEQKQELLTRAAKVHADITRSSGPLDKDFAVFRFGPRRDRAFEIVR